MAVKWDADKDPDDRKDFSFTWATFLATDGDTIATSEWEVVSGDVTIFDTANSDTTTTVWVEGGTAGQNCLLRNRITTTSTPTRQHDRTGKFKVKEL